MKLLYRLHTSGEGGPVRVWQSDWSGDTFEVFSSSEFQSLQTSCKRLAIPLEAALDDED